MRILRCTGVQPLRAKLSQHFLVSVLPTERDGKEKGIRQACERNRAWILLPLLIFSTSGGTGTTATVVYKRIASMIAEKHNKPYSKTIHWIRCRLNFSLLRSSIMCLRGSRSAHHRPAGPPITTNTMDLACSEGRVPGSSQD